MKLKKQTHVMWGQTDCLEREQRGFEKREQQETLFLFIEHNGNLATFHSDATLLPEKGYGIFQLSGSLMTPVT
jgi:hypothetical protein